MVRKLQHLESVCTALLKMLFIVKFDANNRYPDCVYYAMMYMALMVRKLQHLESVCNLLHLHCPVQIGDECMITISAMY